MKKNIFSIFVCMCIQNIFAQFNLEGGKYSAPRSEVVATGDFDGNGEKDIISIARPINAETKGVLYVFLQKNGNIEENAKTTEFFTEPKEYAGITIQVYDFNKDGLDDILFNIEHNIKIMLSNGNGTFSEKVNFEQETSVTAVTLGDLDEDGKMDIAATSWALGYMQVFWGEDNLIFSQPNAFPIHFATGNQLAITRFQDNDFNTLLVLKTHHNYPGIETFSFSKKRELTERRKRHVNDCRGLGVINKNQIVISTGEKVLFLNKKLETLKEISINGYQSLAIGNMDYDDESEIILTGQYGLKTGILKQNGNLYEIKNNSSPVSRFKLKSIHIEDVTSDRRNDILTIDGNSGITVFKGKGAETLSINYSVEKNIINIYPNPTNNIFSINLENIEYVELFNNLGQKSIVQRTLNGYNISHLSSGIYFAKIHTVDGLIYKSKIIKN